MLTKPDLAVSVTFVENETLDVVTVNVAVVLPAGTVTLEGSCAAELLSESDTTIPPEGAGPVRVTVPIDELPPVTDVGLTVTALSAAGLIVKVACTVFPLKVADSVDVVVVVTTLVVTVKVAVVEPANTVTLPGVWAAELLSDRVTTTPPEGAGPFSVTVPVDETPPATEEGFIATELITSGMMLTFAGTVLPL